MRLKDRLKYKDEYCTALELKKVELLKEHYNLSKNARVFILHSWCGREYFLYRNKIFVANFDIDETFELETTEKHLKKAVKHLIIRTLYTVTLKNDVVEDFAIEIPDDTTPKTTMAWNCIEVDCTKKLYTKEDFVTWYNSPCCVNEFVNVPYGKVVEFLNKYNTKYFNSGRYLYYVKRDNDYTWHYFIYAYDLLTKAELKIYADSYIYTKFPEKLSEIYVKDLSGKLSGYQKLQCKKDFFEYCGKECKELKAPNFYALELLKQCIQPIEKDRGWGVNKPFAGTFEFQNIWIDDYLSYDKKPYFVMTEGDNEWLSTRACAIDFFKPEYKSTEPYIAGVYKRNHWNMDKDTLSKLVEFLKSPYDYKKYWYYKLAEKENDTEKMEDIQKRLENSEIKTNWQLLISEYNTNNGDSYGELPLDLPMPDYMKLVKE